MRALRLPHSIYGGDINAQIGELLDRIPRRAPAFAFLDPEGAELSWDTVGAIADHKRGHWPNKVEQLILLPTDTGFVRLLGDTMTDGQAAMVTRMYGHDGWRAIRRGRLDDQLTADEARTEYVRLYANGLRELGYATVLDRQVPVIGRPMYFLLFATDHKAGERIMDATFNAVRVSRDESAQGTLFELPRPTRRRRV